MKVFQIEGNICYWDATRKFPTKDSTIGYFPPDILFVEAPDYVFEGWGYADGEFIKPTAPEGWEYDEKTGTFYDPKYVAPESEAIQSLKSILDSI